MIQNKTAISSQVPIFNKYKNLKHKALKYNSKTQVLCKCEGRPTFRHPSLRSYFLDPNEVRNLSQGANWNFIKGQDSHDLDFRLRGKMVCENGLHVFGPKGLEPIIYSVPLTHTHVH